MAGVLSSTSFDLSLPFRSNNGEEHSVDPSVVGLLGKTGILRDSDGIPCYDPNPKSMHPYKARGLGLDHGELHKLFFYDPVVFGVFSLMMVEVLRAEWFITTHRDETDLEKQKRELLESMFGINGRKGIMGGGLRRLIFHLFWAQLYGFSITEQSFDYVDIDGKRRFVATDCRYRAPWSVYRWLYKGDDLIGFTQLVQPDSDEMEVNSTFANFMKISSTPSGMIERVIPIDKCLLRSNKAVDGNPEGISDFRTAYIYVKAKLDQVSRDQIAEERLSNGIVMVNELGDERGPYKTVSESDRDAVRDMLNALALGKTNRIAVPYGLEIKLDWPTYDRPDKTERLKWLDHQIMIGSTASVLGLDATRAASRGLSDSLATLAFHAIESIADDIASIINGVPGRPYTGLVQKVLDLNFPGDTESRPIMLEHIGISHQDAEKLINTLAKASQMLIYAPDEHDEFRIRRAARFGNSDLDSIKKQREKIVQQSGQLVSQGDQAKIRQPSNPRSKPSNGNGETNKEAKDG